MKRLAMILVVGLCAGAAGPACRKAKQEGVAPAPAPVPAEPSQDPRITKIWITKDGVIQLDGKVVDLGAVEAALTATAKREGVVFYGRDDARAEPHPNAAKITEMIVTRGLPVRLSSKPDFSDAIGPGQ
jgi:hypothetical protein